jgi:hypothetical protein
MAETMTSSEAIPTQMSGLANIPAGRANMPGDQATLEATHKMALDKGCQAD